MAFADKLSTIRQSRKLTQQQLAKKVGIGISQMRRYEKGNSSPTLEVIKNIALTLGTSTDELIFDDNDIAQGKILDRKLLEQFENVSTLPPHDLDVVKTVLESIIVKSKLESIMPTRDKLDDVLLTTASNKMAEESFKQVWDNPEDAEYDNL